MRITKYFRYVPKHFAAVLAILGAAVTVSASFAWGPERPTYTMAHPADHVTFNSITDNPNYGDEREFVTIQDVTAGTGLKSTATLTPGHEYLVQVYVHNNAGSSLNASGKGVAKDVTVRAALPASVNGSETVDGFVVAGNAAPKTVYDSASLKSTGKVDLEFVGGSAMLHTNRQQTKLSDKVITTGVKVGDKDLSGSWRGCLDFAGAVTFKIKVKAQPTSTFEMTKQVRKHSATTGGWVESYAAKPGETVDFVVTYKNTGNITQENVVIKDTLPAGLSYVNGSTVLANGSNPTGKPISDNVTKGGVNIGAYAPGVSAWVRFSAKVADNAGLTTCGANTIHNVASVVTGAGTKTDGADVTVNKTCDQPRMIKVCVLADKAIREIKESDFDSKKHSRNLADCQVKPGQVKVCDEDSGNIITVDESKKDDYLPVDDDACKDEEVKGETPKELASTGPEAVISGLLGSSALGYGAYTYAQSRRALAGKLFKR